jgi:hypothetical protein
MTKPTYYEIINACTLGRYRLRLSPKPPPPMRLTATTMTNWEVYQWAKTRPKTLPASGPG